MKVYQIEDTIVAYFDGRLNDADSAELLHRVSVSPEIRALFMEHREMRALSQRAVQNVVIRSQVEESLFARISAVSEAQKEPMVAPVPSALPSGEFTDRRFAYALVALLLIVAGGFGYMLTGSHGSSPRSTERIAVYSSAPSVSTSSMSPSMIAGNATTSGAGLENTSNGDNTSNAIVSSSQTTHPVASAVRTHSAVGPANVRTPVTRDLASTAGIRDASIEKPAVSIDRNEPMLTSRSPRDAESIILEPRTSGLSSLRSLESIVSDDEPRFDVGFQTSSGFTVPAIAADGSSPFADLRLHGAYSLDTRNAVGVRVTYGLFRTSPVATTIQGAGFETIKRTQDLQRSFAEELYYQHRIPLAEGRFFAIGGVGIGLLSEGNFVSAEVGLQIPFTTKVSADFGFSLMRVHYTGATKQELMSGSSPVVFDGTDIHNTLNGRLQYGLSYRF